MRTLTGALYSTTGEYLAAIPEGATNVQLESISPGGLSRATWTIESGDLVGLQALVRPGSVVEFQDRHGLCWRGRVNDSAYQVVNRTMTIVVEAHGMGTHLSDTRYTTNKNFATGTAMETVITTVRDDRCPMLSSSNRLVTPTGRRLRFPIAAIGKTAVEVYRDVGQLGDQFDNPLAWHVWEGDPRPGTGKAELEFGPRPTTPSYYVSLADGAQATVSMPLSEMYNGVIIRWAGDPAKPYDYSTYYYVADADSAQPPPVGYGWARDRVIQSEYILTAASAGEIGRTYLNRAKRVTPHAGPILIPADVNVFDSAGGVVPPTRVRAGRVIQVTDLRAGASGQAQFSYYIAQATYMDDNGSLSIGTEKPDWLTRTLARLA